MAKWSSATTQKTGSSAGTFAAGAEKSMSRKQAFININNQKIKKMKKITLQLPFLFALLLLSALANAQSLPIKLKVDPSWNRDSTWVLALPNSNVNATTSIGLDTAKKLSTILNGVITLDSGFSGRIYFFVQQHDSSAIMAKINGFPADSSFKVRYDFIEITYTDTTYDCANLSSVDQFGLTLSMAALSKNNNKIGSVGYNVNAKNLISQLQNISSNNSDSAAVFYNDTNHRFIRVMSPLHAQGAYFNLNNYVNLWKNAWQSGVRDTIKIFGKYDGSNAFYVPTEVYATYQAQPFFYKAWISAAGDSVVLQPDPSVACNNAFLQGNITATITSLDSMIYPCDGNFYVSPAVPQLGAQPDKIGYNDPWGTVMRNFLVGFNTGYYNKPVNIINQNYSWNWNPDSAFKFTRADTSYYNQYASIIQSNSNSYGFPFTDFILEPLLSIYQIDTLQVSLWSDTTTNFTDYTPITVDFTGVVPPSANYLNYSQNITFSLFSNDIICPKSSVSLNFCGSTFPIGYSYTAMNPSSTGSAPCDNIVLTGFPIYRDSLNQYPFSIAGQDFNLFIQTDPIGHFINAYCDNPVITTTISPNQFGVTLSGLGYAINPTNLLSGCPSSSTTNTTQPSLRTKKSKHKRSHKR